MHTTPLAPRCVSLNVSHGPQEWESSTQPKAFPPREEHYEAKDPDMVLTQFLSFSEPQFPHVQIGGNNVNHLTGLFVDCIFRGWKLVPSAHSREEDSVSGS